MHRSHSRSTTKFDGWPTDVHITRKTRRQSGRFSLARLVPDYTTQQRQTAKKLQKRKQRQYDRRLCHEDEI